MEAKIVFCICHGPEKGSKYHLETVQTTFQAKSLWKKYRGEVSPMGQDTIENFS